MELLFNDASLHGQFSIQSFRQAVGRLMAMRQLGRRYGRDLKCNRMAAYAQITHDRTMPEVIRFLGRDERSAVQLWLTRNGPFWEDSREHSEKDRMECGGQCVTGTAIAETAHAVLHGRPCGLVSMDPSDWLASPLSVEWRSNGIDQSASVENYWTVEALEKALSALPVWMQSWADMETSARSRYANLTFSTASFEALSGRPFSNGAAKRILHILKILHDFRDCFDDSGKRTAIGNQMYQDYFTGDNALFSDSSDREKSEYKSRLTFPHPETPGEVLFCTWHGKVRTQQLRIHFSWPVRATEPLYVVYVGPKITTR